MNLTDEERQRFVDYCDDYAASQKLIIAEMEKISAPGNLIEQFKSELLAHQIVERTLRAAETQTVE